MESSHNTSQPRNQATVPIRDPANGTPGAWCTVHHACGGHGASNFFFVMPQVPLECLGCLGG